MTRIEGRTEFRRSPAEMFDFLADPRHEPEYGRSDRPSSSVVTVESNGLGTGDDADP